ncbi:hypothetical protein [Streptomyces sp. WELS2]|uniref:hypothetical protein n=1 Tax=Streptomyces sp. WELS2 TaxID=2749435 RepID=UPI0015F0B18E|nr:hypothetical protein [Streptomyces sp. WELS2]
MSPGGRRDLMKDMCPELPYVSGLVGTELGCDGEVVVAEEMFGSAVGNEVLVRDGAGRRFRLSLREVLAFGRAQVIATGPGPQADDDRERASVPLVQLGDEEPAAVRQRAPMEVPTRFRSGGDGLAEPGEPRPRCPTTVPKSP